MTTSEHNYHLSHSGLGDWLECGERYRLLRVEEVPRQIVLWATTGGSAVHAVTEAHDRRLFGDETMTIDFNEALDIAIQAEIDRYGITKEQFTATGKASGRWPLKENEDFWRYMGPYYVRNYLAFREQSPRDILVLDSGEPAIELQFDVELGGGNTPGAADRIFVNRAEKNRLEIWDIKSGSRTPSSLRQLAIYAYGFTATYGTPVWKGAYFMTRKGKTAQVKGVPIPSGEAYGPWDLGAQLASLDFTFSQVYDAIDAGLFPARESDLCGLCPVRNWCYLRGDKELSNLVKPF